MYNEFRNYQLALDTYGRWSDMATIGERIRGLRELAGMTQEEFGKLFGVVKSTVSLYESGKSTPNDQIKMQICKHFDVSLDYLLGLSDKPGQSKFDDMPEDKKSPLAVGQGDRIIQNALKDTGLLSEDGSLTPGGEKAISDYLARNADLLKLLAREEDKK